MKNRFIPLLFLCYFIAYSHSFALDKDEVIAYFQNSLKGLSSISLNFSDESHKGIAGSLNAIKGNKYRLIVKIVFVANTIKIDGVFTHAEYDKIDFNKRK